MALVVEWFPRALDDLIALPDWRLATIIDAAVDRYAVEGVGFVLRVEVHDGPDISITHSASARLRADSEEREHAVCGARDLPSVKPRLRVSSRPRILAGSRNTTTSSVRCACVTGCESQFLAHAPQ